MGMERAVAYIRVSTKSDAQLHSYGYQLDYWQNFIAKKKECEFMGLYADKGISGRSLYKRPQFKRMIADAHEKKFDVIYTKSVARFARNVEELLETVRGLREIGVRVFFEKEQIDTFDPTAEIYLTIAAAIAESELEVYSENQRWSIHEKYKNGFVSAGSRIYGYRMNQATNTLEVVPEEAKVVKRIFEMYLSGVGFLGIAKKLSEEGIPNGLGETTWSRGTIRYMLTNEKYIGCALMQKTYAKGGVLYKNDGRYSKYYVENTHEAIVAKEDYDKVQAIMASRKRADDSGQALPTYLFSRRIHCGICGGMYCHRLQNAGKPYEVAVWVCTRKDFMGKSYCQNSRIKESVLMAKFVECFNEFVTSRMDDGGIGELKSKLAQLVSQEKELNALRINHMVNADDCKELEKEIRDQIEAILKQIEQREIRCITKSDYVPIETFDADKFEKFIDAVSITNHLVTFHFINGVAISREFNNGRAGNSKGWYERRMVRLQREAEVK